MIPLTVELIKQEVERAIAAHEPRANVLNVAVTPDEENNRYKVSVLFDLSTETEAQLLETLFERA